MSLTGTTDIEVLARGGKASMVTWFMGTISAFPGLSTILSWPLVGPWLKGKIEEIVVFLIETLELVPFFINSKALTTSQGQDYLKALMQREALPETVSDRAWEKAEYAVNTTFDNLIKSAR